MQPSSKTVSSAQSYSYYFGQLTNRSVSKANTKKSKRGKGSFWGLEMPSTVVFHLATNWICKGRGSILLDHFPNPAPVKNLFVTASIFVA